jgi:hypothetical protein
MPLMRSPNRGDLVDVPDDQVAAAVSQGFAPVTPAEEAAEGRAQAQQAGHGGVVGALNAGLTGFLSGLTVGGSDVALSAIMNKEQAAALAADRAAHPIESTVGTIAGAVAPSLLSGGELAPAALASRAGAGVAERVGGGLAGRVAGSAAEGAIFGAGQGVSDLALSNDPLTAEHVASVLSSNVLLGGVVGGVAGAGTRLFERGLQIAGDKLAAAQGARAAIEGLPADLQGLDDAGLKDAYASAKAEHAADIAAEKQSLEGIRANQRAEIASQVKELHEDLATERPIYEALSNNDDLNPKLAGIEGVSDARVQLAKSFRSLRSALDNPIANERDPFSLIRPLEQRQAALETLQDKLPELHAAMAGDERAAVLEHVDQALQDTRQQIASIRALKEAPLSSGRLTALEAGPSARMQAIDDARAALKNAPELGLAGKAASGAAFAGGTALAHMIPGVGLAAPFVGKAAANAVETLFRRGASVIGKVGEKASGAAQKFLGAAKALEPLATPTATKVLSTVRFGASKDAGDDLPGLFRARTAELYQQTERLPDGTTQMRMDARVAMAKKLDPIRQVNPILADQIETVQARKVAYLAHVAPKKPEPPALQIGPDTSRPSDLAIRAWARAVRAVEDPASVEERLARGIVTPEEAAAYRAVYPARFEALQREIFAAAPTLDKTLPMSKKVALSIFTGIPVTPAMQPNVLAVLQATFAVEPGSAGGTQAPRPQPNFGPMGSLKDLDKPTPAQQREGAGGR